MSVELQELVSRRKADPSYSFGRHAKRPSWYKEVTDGWKYVPAHGVDRPNPKLWSRLHMFLMALFFAAACAAMTALGLTFFTEWKSKLGTTALAIFSVAMYVAGLSAEKNIGTPRHYKLEEAR